jgi:hypothetical protein
MVNKLILGFNPKDKKNSLSKMQKTYKSQSGIIEKR